MRSRSLFSRPIVFVAVVGLVAGTFAWSQLGDAVGATTTLDKITYNQQTGSNGTYIQYVPGDGSKVTKQSVTSGGGCATPSPSGVPILGFSAKYYAPVANQPPYSGTPSTAIVGAYKSRTGVCQTPQAWSIEQNEALLFAVGANTLVAGRQFSRAVLQLERQDKSTAADPAVQVQLVLRAGANVVATQNVAVPGPNGTAFTADTGSAYGFTSIEVRVLSPAAGSISVVGPTSTFYLANQICGGETITTTSSGGTISTGEVTASFYFDAASNVCKSYTLFEASSTDTDPNSGGKSVTFLSQELAGAHIIATFDWGNFPYCRPDSTPDPSHPGAPECPTSTVDVGNGPVAQTFCAPYSPGPPPTGGATLTTPWCTTDRHFEYLTDPANSSATLVHITETWDGLGDVVFRRG